MLIVSSRQATSAVCNENVNVNQSDPNKSAPSLSKVLEEPFRDIEVPDEGAICNTVVCSSIFAILNHQRMQEWLSTQSPSYEFATLPSVIL